MHLLVLQSMSVNHTVKVKIYIYLYSIYYEKNFCWNSNSGFYVFELMIIRIFFFSLPSVNSHGFVLAVDHC